MSIYKKLFEAKKEIGKISKDSKNPFFKSKYFDVNSLLEHVEPILQIHELLLLQPIIENKVRTCLFDVETSQEVFSEMTLPNIQDPQKLGSAITYYRRYTLQSLLGLQAEDDDGNKASNKTNTNKNKSKKNKSYKECKTKAELTEFWKTLNQQEKSNLQNAVREFSLTLPE